MKAIILAAGYATRMYPLTHNQPKALLPLGGRAIIDYIVDQINTLPETDEIVVVSNHKFIDAFKAWADNAVSKIPITVLDDGSTSVHNQRGAINDTYFAVCERHIDDDVVVIAGDNYFTFALREFYDFFRRCEHDAICAKYLADRAQLSQFAVAVLDGDGKVLSLIEKPAEPPSNMAVYATYFYRKETVPLLAQYLAAGNNPDQPGHFPQWLHTVKDVYAYVMNGDCYDLGTIAAYNDIQARIADLESDRA